MSDPITFTYSVTLPDGQELRPEPLCYDSTAEGIVRAMDVLAGIVGIPGRGAIAVGVETGDAISPDWVGKWDLVGEDWTWEPNDRVAVAPTPQI